MPADPQESFFFLSSPYPSALGPLTGWPDPGLEQKMVYLRITPLGLAGGSQDTTTLLADEGTALMPAGGPGAEQGEVGVSLEKGAQPLGKNDMLGRGRLINLGELLGGGVLELWLEGGGSSLAKWWGRKGDHFGHVTKSLR